jgi:hypothetical protein
LRGKISGVQIQEAVIVFRQTTISGRLICGQTHIWLKLHNGNESAFSRERRLMTSLIHPVVSDGVAPGGPGSAARWTSSAKTCVGTALSSKSNVWFTPGDGILTEVYYRKD